MVHCSRCGKEYDGKFCPECGTPARRANVCPRCGAAVTEEAAFCTECGKKIATDVARERKRGRTEGASVEEKIGTADRILAFLPAALFALFAVLLFAFFAAPVQTVLGESVGNAYGLYSSDATDVPPGVIPSMVVFAVLSLLVAAAWAVTLFVPVVNRRTVRLFGVFRVRYATVAMACSWVCYFALFILSCIAVGSVNSAYLYLSELGAAGACPVLILVFSLLFGILGGAAPAARAFLRKKFPSLNDGKTEEGAYLPIGNAVASENAPDVSEDVQEELPAPEKPAYADRASALSRLSKKIKIYRVLLLLSLLALADVVVSICGVFIFDYRFDHCFSFLSFLFYYSAVSLVSWSVALIGIVLCICLPVRKFRQRGACSSGAVVLRAILMLAALAIGMGLSVAALSSSEFAMWAAEIEWAYTDWANAGGFFIYLFGSLLPVYVVFIVLFFVAANGKKNKELRLALFGSEKIGKDAQPLIADNEIPVVRAQLAEWRKAKAAYRAEERRRMAVRRYEKKLVADGLNPAEKPPAFFYLTERYPLACAAVTAVAVVGLVAVMLVSAFV